MTNLAALKVKIGMKPDGSALYPDFGALASVDGDWAQWIDRNGPGWLYDKLSGHRDDTPESPQGQQWGVLLVPEAFVIEAAATYPGECARLTELEIETFYGAQIAPAEDDARRDDQVLSALQSEKALKGTDAKLDARIAKALDPMDPAPGVRENPRKDWATFKARKGITVI